jgi:hypothetical protein
MGGKWMDCIPVRRDELQDFMTMELDKATALERFERWMDKKGIKRSEGMAILPRT